MRIQNSLLFDDRESQVRFVESPNHGGSLDPRYLIMHFTAGSSAEGSIQHLTRESAKASAHLVIGRDGEITQLVPFDRVAWHAGRSRWQGITGLNQFSIGIELDNAGDLTETSAGWVSWFERIYPEHEVLVAAHKHDGVERGWHRYTEAQLDAAFSASEAIVDQYGLVDILGHDDIAPERKKDPGPAFPMDRFRNRLLGRRDDAFEHFETTTGLNIRTGPGVEFDKLDESPLAKGTHLALELRDASWCFVEVLADNGDPIATGWVHGNFIRPIEQ